MNIHEVQVEPRWRAGSTTVAEQVVQSRGWLNHQDQKLNPAGPRQPNLPEVQTLQKHSHLIFLTVQIVRNVKMVFWAASSILDFQDKDHLSATTRTISAQSLRATIGEALAQHESTVLDLMTQKYARNRSGVTLRAVSKLAGVVKKSWSVKKKEEEVSVSESDEGDETADQLEEEVREGLVARFGVNKGSPSVCVGLKPD